MLKVSVGTKNFRTHSLDRVAHRLYGQKAVAIVVKNEDGEDIQGVFAVPMRSQPGVFRLRETFKAEDTDAKDKEAPKRAAHVA
jgi:hypothetical protein